MRPSDSTSTARSGRGTGTGRQVARRLPFPRDLAAAALWSDLRALLAGRPPGGVPVREARLRRDTARGRELLRGGRAGAAVEVADALLAIAPASVPAFWLKLDAEVATGRSRDALRTIRALRRREDAPKLAALERRLAGLVLVEETDWVPGLPAAAPCHDPDGPSLVLVPGDDLGPEGSRWVEGALEALAAAGLRPVVLVVRGAQPGSAGDHVAALPGPVSRVRIDLGPSWPADAPADRRILDVAWAAASVARTMRPARVVALVGGSGDALVAGVALGEATGCPAIAVVAAAEPGRDWPGTSARRLERARAVIAAPDPMAQELLEFLRRLPGDSPQRPAGV